MRVIRFPAFFELALKAKVRLLSSVQTEKNVGRQSMIELVLFAALLFPPTESFNSYPTLDRLAYFKLPSETHQVITDDGYILTLFRITNRGSTPVLMVHGFLASSDIWLLLPRKEQNIATILHSAGYDVWLMNFRGNEYSRKHVNLSTETHNSKYWDFGFHEVGVYDIPSAIDHILNETKHESLLYIGHSMGTTVCLVACTERPEYNTKIRAAVFLAPIVYPYSEDRVPFVSLIVNSANLVSSLFYYLDVFELMGQNVIKDVFIRTFCGLQLTTCSKIYAFLFRQNLDNIIVNDLPFYLKRSSTGTSVRLYQHIADIVGSGLQNFTRYNYGPEKNLVYYGTEYPPRYEIEKVTAPIAIFHSQSDAFVDSSALNRIRASLKSIIFDYNVPEPSFQHMDYLYGLNARKLVATQILKIFNRYKDENLYSNQFL